MTVFVHGRDIVEFVIFVVAVIALVGLSIAERRMKRKAGSHEQA
jgi:hypothetical protein